MRRSPRIGISSRTIIALGIALLSLHIGAGCRKPPVDREEMLKSLSPSERRALSDPSANTPLVVDGIDSPEMITATEAELPLDAEVIGVIIDDQPRAYPVTAMTGMMDHVVNDSGVTITYCDRSDCVRALAAEPLMADSAKFRETGLGVGTMGLRDGALIISWNGESYDQTAPIIGLRDVPYERVSWDDWRREHPDTLVYRGPR